MLCEGRVRWIQALTFYFLPTCIHICSYIKFPMFVLKSFLRFFFFFSQQDGYVAKVALVSCIFENPLTRTSYFSTILNSKHKICRLNLSRMTQQFFKIDISIFTCLKRSMEKDFAPQNQLWKLFCRIRNQMPQLRRRVSNDRVVSCFCNLLCQENTKKKINSNWAVISWS